MLEIVYDFDTEGDAHEDAFLDPYELNLMFEQTRQSLDSSLHRKLTGITCAEHGKAPRVTITGRYNQETEEMDISYHVDTCCQVFLLQVIRLLNAR